MIITERGLSVVNLFKRENWQQWFLGEINKAQTESNRAFDEFLQACENLPPGIMPIVVKAMTLRWKQGAASDRVDTLLRMAGELGLDVRLKAEAHAPGECPQIGYVLQNEQDPLDELISSEVFKRVNKFFLKRFDIDIDAMPIMDPPRFQTGTAIDILHRAEERSLFDEALQVLMTEAKNRETFEKKDEKKD